MIAFEIHEGCVRRCDDSGRVRRVALPSLPLPRVFNVPHSKNARRRWARVGKNGRRGARRVAAPSPQSLRMPTLDLRVEVAHLLSGHRIGAVLLYLPEGEAVTQAHCDLVAAFVERK